MNVLGVEEVREITVEAHSVDLRRWDDSNPNLRCNVVAPLSASLPLAHRWLHKVKLGLLPHTQRERPFPASYTARVELR